MDPEFAENGNTDEPALPVSQNEEFKPFARRLPEFKWVSFFRSIIRQDKLKLDRWFHFIEHENARYYGWILQPGMCC